jgi:Leucine-rich repeat (LRR) protein
LRQLQKLDLYDTGITDAGLEHLKGLRQLQELNLSGTAVTDAGLEHLKGLKQLRMLDLSFTKVKGLLEPTERESHGPQFVGLDADPVDGNRESTIGRRGARMGPEWLQVLANLL